MKRSATISAAALVLVVSTPHFGVVSVPASAQEWRDRDRDRNGRDRETRRGRDERDEHDRERAALRDARLTLEDAIAVARRELPGGRVVDADVETRNGIVSYAIDIDRDGVRRVLVDPNDGRVLDVARQEDDGSGEDDDDDDDDDDEDEGPRRP